MRNEDRIFALDAGRLYVARGDVDAEELRTPACYAGPTDGGITLSYTSEVYEITDDRGCVIDTIPYGEKTTVSGKLARFQTRVLAGLTGCPRRTAEGSVSVTLGGRGTSRRQSVSVLLVCPLPDGEEFTLYARCAADSGASLRFSKEHSGAISFSLTADEGGALLTVGEVETDA